MRKGKKAGREGGRGKGGREENWGKEREIRERKKVRGVTCEEGCGKGVERGQLRLKEGGEGRERGIGRRKMTQIEEGRQSGLEQLIREP